MTLRYPRPASLSKLGPGHNVVESSAGTGKTFLLEHLFVELIVKHDIPAEQILVVTFTEKAAAELLLRVRGLLSALASLEPGDRAAVDAAALQDGDCWLLDERAKQRLARAQLAFNRVSISTIHGFCQRVLREHAFGQGRLFDEELADGKTVFGESFREVLRTVAASDPSLRRLLAAWLDGGKNVAQLEQLLWQCEEKAAEVLRPAFDEPCLASALAAWRPVAADDERLKKSLKATGIHGRKVTTILDRLGQVSAIVDACAGDSLGFLARLHGEAKGRLSEALTRLADGALDGDLADLERRVRELDEAAVPLAAVVAQLFLPVVKQRAASRKRGAGRYDYSDMLALVAGALDDPGPAGQALLAALRGRYRHGLIDEFQDTDRTQWSIFRRIFVGAPGGRHGLTVVGDPKQAIYGFRGADVRTYLEASSALRASGAQSLALSRNFRSTGALIDATNLLLAQPGFFRPGSGITYDRPVTCGRPQRALASETGQPEPPVMVLSLQATRPQVGADQVRDAIASAIIEELRGLVDPACPLRLRDGERSKPVDLRGIFILTFSNSECFQVGAALGRAGIRYAFYKLGDLWQSAEARDILDVLRALCAPEDRGLRKQALLTRFFGLGLTDLAALPESEASSPPVQVLLRLASEAARFDVPTFFSMLVERTGILRRELWKGDSERGLTNVMHVFELLAAEWAATRASLPELVTLLEAYVSGSAAPAGQDSDLQRLETDENCVQILTVHKAKGLEADVVFLYGGLCRGSHEQVQLFHEEVAGSQRRALFVGKPEGAIAQRVAEEAEDEQSRLHYVALTRPRYRLYLPRLPPEFPRLDGSYARVNRFLGQALEQADARGLFGERLVPCPPTSAEKPAASPRGPAEARIPPALLATPPAPADVGQIRRERAGFAVTSYSTVKRLRAGLAVEDDVTAPSTHESPAAPAPGGLPGGADTGIYLHEILAEIPLGDLAESPPFAAWHASPGVAALLGRLRRRHARPAAHAELAARMVHAAYTTPVRLGETIIPGLAKASEALREMEFLYPIPERGHSLLGRLAEASAPQVFTIERGVVKGFIDLLFEHEGMLYVCDWKSDQLGSYDEATLARHCDRHYDVQARLYTLAALRMTGIGTEGEYLRRFGGLLYYFLRGQRDADGRGGAVFFKPAWQQILAWQGDMLTSAFWGLS